MRPIGSEGYASVPAGRDTGPAPILQWIPIEHLVVDETYQRPITNQGRRNVQHIAERFEWPKFAPVVVAPVEGGRFAIIDGQHRTTAAHLRGFSTVPCMIVPVDRRGQAEAFGAINAVVTRLTQVQLHKAAIAANDPRALAIQQACDAAGVIITHSSTITILNARNGAAPERTASVQAIGKYLTIFGPRIVVVALKAIVAATSAGCLLNGAVIGAVSTLFHSRDEWLADEPRLLASIEVIDLSELTIEARSEALRRPGVDASTLLQAKLFARLDRKLGRAA